MSATDAGSWVARWDEQQERYLPHREERFRIILDVVERVVGTSPRLLDVCCGTGSISCRALERFPEASIVAVDMDPAHLELGRRTLGDRVDWHDLDLRQPGWADGFEPGSFDAAGNRWSARRLIEPVPQHTSRRRGDVPTRRSTTSRTIRKRSSRCGR